MSGKPLTQGGAMVLHKLECARVLGRAIGPLLVGGFSIAGCGMSVPITEDGTAGVIGRSKDDRTPRPDSKEACDRCGGLWGVHGIAPKESCICRTKDGRQSC